MKGLSLAAVIGLALIWGGCAHRGMVKSSSSSTQSAQMRAFVDFGDVVKTNSGLRITLSADTLFRKHSHHLSKDGLAKLDSIAAVLLKYPNDQVAVNGYTDNVGTDMKNVKFSQRRADSVKAELVKQGVAKANVSAVGNGPAEPVGDNTTENGRMQNRRIVLEISAL